MLIRPIGRTPESGSGNAGSSPAWAAGVNSQPSLRGARVRLWQSVQQARRGADRDPARPPAPHPGSGPEALIRSRQGYQSPGGRLFSSMAEHLSSKQATRVRFLQEARRAELRASRSLWSVVPTDRLHGVRSEERRVGKECSALWVAE